MQVRKVAFNLAVIVPTNFRIKLIKAVRYLRPEKRRGLIKEENQESSGEWQIVQTPIEDDVTDSKTSAVTSNKTSTSDVIGAFDPNPGNNTKASQFQGSDRPGVLKIALSTEHWKRLSDKDLDWKRLTEKETEESGERKGFRADESPEDQNGPCGEMITERIPAKETGSFLTSLYQSGITSSTSKSHPSESNVQDTKEQDRRYPKDTSGVNFINILRAHFPLNIFGARISNQASFVVFGAKISY
jgi:hypothetical protein